jgi:hypothetical protein
MCSGRLAILAVLIAACGGSRASGPSAALRPSCPPDQLWDGSRCTAQQTAAAAIERAARALADFQPDAALAELDRARAAGPHRHELLVELYEQLGIAHAYLGHDAEATAAFEMLLTLAPRHLLSYTLSPQVTFLFERVRKNRDRIEPPVVDLSWPRELEVTDPVPIDVEVVRDRRSLLSRATLEVRRKGTGEFRSVDLALAEPGDYRRVVLPRVGGTGAGAVEIFLRAYDDAGNEVLRWGSDDRPREIPLGYEAPTPWYRNWWVWAVAGTAVAATTGVTVYLIQREPPDLVDGGLDVTR